ncbi:MAG: methyltransferase domain-containing protein [Clostridia bacterium]|nr:methyltransferase domain-containing protein [Clostridia bacterium]
MGYQVFISFKNTENNEFTQDRQVSEELYNYLESRGIKTFYSNVTLLDYGEAQYKEVIDDVLDEVKVMVVVGSKKEYITSKWCKYEWHTYQQNILSNIVEGSIVTYLGDMEISEVPTGLRHYQSFKLNQSSIEVIGEFVVRAVNGKGQFVEGKNSQVQKGIPAKNNLGLVNEFGEKKASYYDSTFSGEYKRLKIQGEAMRPSDMKGVNYVKEQLKDTETVYILDAGCGYGVVGRDRFADFSNKVIIGIDISDAVLEKARELNDDENAHYEKVDLLSSNFDEEIEMIMGKYKIKKFDVVFGAYVLQHIKDPLKALRNLRTCLSEDGYVIFRQSDEGTYIAYGDDGLVRKICERYLNAPGIDDRFIGRKMFHYLEATGYKNIKVFGTFINTSSMGYDDRMALYKMRFSLRTMYYQKELAKNPNNTIVKNDMEWMNSALDKLQEVFGSPSFWFGETMLVSVARKTDIK